MAPVIKTLVCGFFERDYGGMRSDLVSKVGVTKGPSKSSPRGMYMSVCIYIWVYG